MRIVRQASFKAVPWKNGGGITHEAIRVPANGDPFRWRVSVARIDASGPFSDFSGYDRKMILLKGRGVALRFANGAVRALRAVGDMAEFDGALAARCDLVGGPCVDLNLIAAKALPGVSAQVARVRETLTVPAAAGRATLAFPIDAAVEISRGSERAVLEAWDLAVLPGGRDLMLRIVRRADPQTSAAVAQPYGADCETAAVFLADLPE
jgi:environmental stress-induced protein Ves